uniref:Putative ribonuclease H-like domain-containing protein n=1 Tax=Tanacetum cinerariifolium TaxID=118510 RepID=A0A6L2NH59_TANCI|nr:putative ribonuclease H-like domain-containing protein [Tanacetum cinerariifolium]
MLLKESLKSLGGLGLISLGGFHVKLDELGGILKNKARLVVRGYRQEEGIDFEDSFAPSACDVYSKRRIIAVTELRIVEWHNYKHLDWITKADKSDSRRLLCFQRLSSNVLGIIIPTGRVFCFCWQVFISATSLLLARGELIKRRIYRSDPKPFLINSKEKPNLISLSKMSDHEDETITEENAPLKVVPQITTVINIYAKFPYLKKGYAKSMTTDNDGNLKIRPPTITVEEHQQMNTLKIKPEPEDVNMQFLKGLPPSWSSIALIIKTKGGLEYISFDDLYNKLKFLEFDTKRYSSSSSTLSNAAFMNKKDFEEYDLKHQMAMLSIKVHRFEKKHRRKIKFNGRENARFDKKLVKCFNCKQMGHFSRECRAQSGQNSKNYQKYKSKEAGKDGSDSKAMVVVDGSIDWDKQTKEGNTEPRSLENFGMVAGTEIASYANSEGEVVFADNVIPAGVSVFVGHVAAAVLANEEKIKVLSYELEEKSNILEYRQKLIDQAAQEKQELITKLDNKIANQAKWNNSGKNLYKLIDSSMSVRTKRGLGLDKYIREGELGIDDSKFSVFHTNNDELKGQPIYNRFASVDHMKTVPPPITRNYMPPSNIPDIDESQMVYEKKATDSSEIKTNDDSISHSNDSVLFDFSDRSSEPSTNDLQMCDSSVECSRPKHSDHDSTDSIFSVSASASESRDTIVIDCDRQEDFPSVCSIETDVKSSKTLCNKFGSFNKESHFRKHKSVAYKSCYVCGSYLHLIKDCDLHEQRFAKRNDEGKGILGRRPIGKPVNPNRPKPVFAGQQNPVSAGPPNPVSAEQQNTVSAGQPNPVSAGYPNPVSIGEATLACNSIPLSVSAGDNSLRLEKAKDRGIIDSGCSRSMSGNKDKLEDFEDFNGGELTFGGSTRKILGKATIKTKNLYFENVLYVTELHHFNLISVSQICDQTHRVVFTENESLVLSKDFPLPDPSMVILSILKKHNLYTFSLNELAPKGPLTCLIAKASQNESSLWHRRLGHVNFKNMNKMVKGNLFRGLPSKVFQNDHTCVACNKGKQHNASYKAIPSISLITEPLHLLHTDLFGPTFVRSINNKYYLLVITDEYTRFSWVYFLEHKSDTFLILKNFITLVENQFNHKVKAIRCDNGTEFKNANLIKFCGSKGIRRDYSNARTPQQNGVAERKNQTLIEAARTMLADSLLPTIFWSEAVATACYVLNRVLVTKPRHKNPYELLTRDKPSISYLKPFGCHVTILNTSDLLGKFDKKLDEGYIVGYSISSKLVRSQ